MLDPQNRELARVTQADDFIVSGQLVSLLAQTRTMDPEPELQFQPDGFASYELANQVLKVIKESGVTKFGFVGNEQFAGFGKVGSE